MVPPQPLEKFPHLPAYCGALHVSGAQHWSAGSPVVALVDVLQICPPVHTPVQLREPPQPSLNVPHVPAGLVASTAAHVVGVQHVFAGGLPLTLHT
jgi:hypothetical protein